MLCASCVLVEVWFVASFTKTTSVATVTSIVVELAKEADDQVNSIISGREIWQLAVHEELLNTGKPALAVVGGGVIKGAGGLLVVSVVEHTLAIRSLADKTS